jgi:hypothetical protein
VLGGLKPLAEGLADANGAVCCCGLSVLSVNCVPQLIVLLGHSLGFRCGEKCGDSMHALALPATFIPNHFRV